MGLQGIALGLFLWWGATRAGGKGMKEGRDFRSTGLKKGPEASILTFPANPSLVRCHPLSFLTFRGLTPGWQLSVDLRDSTPDHQFPNGKDYMLLSFLSPVSNLMFVT